MSTSPRAWRLSLLAAALAIVIAALVWWTQTGNTRHAAALQAANAQNLDAPRAPTDLEAATPKAPARAAAERRTEIAPPTIPGARKPPEFLVIGRCIDESNRPIEGASIALQWYTHGTPQVPLTEKFAESLPGTTVDTDVDGTFEIHFDTTSPEHDDVLSVFIIARLSDRSGEEWRTIERSPDVPTFDAGDLVLLRGAVLSGVVHDVGDVPQADFDIDATIGTGQSVLGGSSWVGRGNSARTFRDGRFTIAGVRPGRVRVRARGDDMRESNALEITVAPGERRDDLELVVPMYDDEFAVTGVVVDPTGGPVGRAQMTFRRETKARGEGAGGALRCGADGRFRFAGFEGSVFSLRADDPEHRFVSASQADIKAGTHGLRLVLGLSNTYTLRVRAEDGSAIESFGLIARKSERLFSTILVSVAEAPHPNGELTLAADPEPFTLDVNAIGFVTTTTARLSADHLPSAVEVRLPRAATIRGIVTASGVPVADAAIQVLGPNEERTTAPRRPGALHESRGSGWSNTSGEFRLTPTVLGTVVVRAEAAGHPLATSQPIVLTAGGDVRDLALELGVGARLEGSVLSVDGKNVARADVDIALDDTHKLSTVSDDRGQYRFVGLTPGEWQVRAHAGPEASTVEPSRAPTGPTSPDTAHLAWGDVRLREGEATHFDVMVPVRCILALKPEAPLDTGLWHVLGEMPCEAHTIGRTTAHELLPADRDRHAEFACPGECTLRAEGTIAGTVVYIVTVRTLVAGLNKVALGIPIGSIQGRVANATPGQTKIDVSWTRESDHTTCSVRGDIDAQGRFTLPFAPAGTCTLEVVGRDAPSKRTVEVRAGQTLVIDDL